MDAMSVAELKQAMLDKVAAGRTATNEDEPTKGKANVYLPPEGCEPNIAGGNVGYSAATLAAARETREEMMERLFDAPKTTAASEQALIHGLFSEEAIRERQVPHSILQRREKTKTASADETLTDKVLRVTGRR